jgi:hypothetical protein
VSRGVAAQRLGKTILQVILEDVLVVELQIEPKLVD